MRSYTITEYDSEDIESLDGMQKEKVIELLEHIARGWLPQDYVCGTKKGCYLYRIAILCDTIAGGNPKSYRNAIGNCETSSQS